MKTVEVDTKKLLQHISDYWEFYKTITIDQMVSQVEGTKLIKTGEYVPLEDVEKLEANYLSAVQGRKDFRAAYKKARKELQALRKDVEDYKETLKL